MTAWDELLRLVWVTRPFENCMKMPFPLHFQEVPRSPNESPRDGSWVHHQMLLVSPTQPSFPSGSP